VPSNQGEGRGGADGDESSYFLTGRLKISAVLVPPKPKALESATFTRHSRARLGMTSIGHAGSCSSTLTVGGKMARVKASTVKMASAAPAAPSMCPVIDLVADGGGGFGRKTGRIASASAMPPAGVEVAWALM